MPAVKPATETGRPRLAVRLSGRLDSRRRLRRFAAMPNTHTAPSALSTRLCALACEAQLVADELIAQYTSEDQFEMLLSGPLLAFTLLMESLEDAVLHRCENLLVDAALVDRAIAREFVEAHSSQPSSSPRSSSSVFSCAGSSR